MSCQKIISGGQTGVDRGILDAALESGFPCGGWCPPGRMAADGRISEKYPLTELATGGYEERTMQNVKDSDGTLVITCPEPEGGTCLTIRAAGESGKPLMIVNPLTAEGLPRLADSIREWMCLQEIKILNCAGPRAGEWHEGYRLAHDLGICIIDSLRGAGYASVAKGRGNW